MKFRMQWLNQYIEYKYIDEKNIDESIEKDFTNYIFKNNLFKAPNNNFKAKKEVVISKDSIDNYLSKKYKTRFTMDIGQAYYGFGVSGNDYSGGNGMAQFLFSDILGDHKNIHWY